MAFADAAPSPQVLYPPKVSLSEAWPWLALAASLMSLIYLVGLDGGALSLAPGSYVHEWVHDGRHLLGFPCH
ncbi:MAG: CbtB-domain containing protein [Solirubrobacterales bacterium]|nr:CbtB-domain containing protein [Solirubrobacterales bacterium]